MSEHIIETETSAGVAFVPIGGTANLREEIVRCRDCKRYHPKEGKMFSCKFEYGEFAQWRSAEPDGFCAWAEREEGGDD